MAEAVGADVSVAVTVMFEALPMSGLLSDVATVLVLVFFVAPGDPATLVLGMTSTGSQLNPNTRVKAIRGALVPASPSSQLLTSHLPTTAAR